MEYYYLGNIQLLDTPCVTVVGTRTPSEWAKQETISVSDCLRKSGFTIVSGLARGIDTIALFGLGNRIAVLPTSLDNCYPPENQALKDSIGKTGLLLSPFKTGTITQKWHFLKRNKLMVDISQASIVIEDNDNGGATRLADYAISISKPVFTSTLFYNNKNFKWQRNLETIFLYSDYSSLIKALKDSNYKSTLERKKQLELF